MSVLFNSSRPLGRCENITAVWNAYDGPKKFVQGGFANVAPFRSCPVVVTDEFVQRKASGQTVVMIGHGLTAGKLYGADQRNGRYASDEALSLVDYYVATSAAGVKIAARCANMPESRCPPLGMPRTDAYFGASKCDGGTPLGKFGRSYLYAPTFRAWYDTPAPDIDWEGLDATMDDDELLVVKRHMVTGKPLLGGRRFVHIVEADNAEPSTPYLIDCDVLVTDYSSILFDGYLLGKPSVLVCDDMDDYLRTRGMYREYPRQYGSRWLAAAGHEDAFLEQLREAAETGMRDAEREARDFAADACDGHSSERVARFVRELL